MTPVAGKIKTTFKPARPPLTVIFDEDGKGGMVGAFSIDEIRKFFGGRVEIKESQPSEETPNVEARR